MYPLPMAAWLGKWLTRLIFIGLVLAGLYFVGHKNGSAPVATKSSSVTPLTAAQAWSHIGDTATVEYRVAYTATDSAGDEFLNEDKSYLDGFTAVVFQGELGYFASDPIATYGGQTIDVTGQIQSYEGHPEILVTGDWKIHVVGS